MLLADILGVWNCGNHSKLTLMLSRYFHSWVHVPSYQLVNLVPCELTLSSLRGLKGKETQSSRERSD